MMHQSMSGQSAQIKIDKAAQEWAVQIANETLSLEAAHSTLLNANLDLFQMAGLAKAIACFQCAA